MGFWERTWTERTEAILQAYGQTSPPETVTSFSWDDGIRCPGACAMAFPPVEASHAPPRSGRADWLYLTLGLSQPVDQKQVAAERAAGKSYSAHGMEFAFVTPTESPWAAEALYFFMTYMTEGELIQWGDRFPFGFQQHSNGSLGVYTGQRTADVRAVGAIQSVLFWPFLFPQSTFLTGTGKFLVMVATGITRQEWELAKKTTTAHVLLLLCRAGIAQRTLPDRECLMASPRWRDEWTRIEALAPEACEQEFEARIDHWHVG